MDLVQQIFEDIFSIQFYADNKMLPFNRTTTVPHFVMWLFPTEQAGADGCLKSTASCFIHKKLRGLSPRANYTDRAAAASRWS